MIAHLLFFFIQPPRFHGHDLGIAAVYNLVREMYVYINKMVINKTSCDIIYMNEEIYF